MSKERSRLQRLLFAEPIFTPKGFASRAVVIAILYLICHIAGMRDYTSLLSGTLAMTSGAKTVSAFLGIAYMFLYFAAVIIVPILLIGAGIFRVLLSAAGRKET